MPCFFQQHQEHFVLSFGGVFFTAAIVRHASHEGVATKYEPGICNETFPDARVCSHSLGVCVLHVSGAS